MISDSESTCEVVSYIDSDAYRVRVSKGREIAFPHIIVGWAVDGRAKGVRIRPGCINGPDPRLLNKQDVSSRGLQEGMSESALSIHIDRRDLKGPLRH